MSDIELDRSLYAISVDVQKHRNRLFCDLAVESKSDNLVFLGNGGTSHYGNVVMRTIYNAAAADDLSFFQFFVLFFQLLFLFSLIFSSSFDFIFIYKNKIELVYFWKNKVVNLTQKIKEISSKILRKFTEVRLK